MFIYCCVPVFAAASGSDAVPSGGDAAGGAASGTDSPAADAPAGGNDVMETTASQIAKEINLGWNLGDSFDSWDSSAGYDDYHNANAYQMVLRYDDANHERSTSINIFFDENNKATYKWATGLITSDPQVKLGDIGFEIWNYALEEETTITVKVTKALLTRRSGIAYKIKDLLGEHTATISNYGTVAILTENFPSNVTKTYGITDGFFELTVELVDFPQKEYDKVAYFETLRNNPFTTYEMIEQVRNAGFNAVRIPITFFNHTVSGTNVVDTPWLDRIQEVVDYAYHQDMYVILCMDNDGSSTGWLRVTSTDAEKTDSRFEAVWTQVAERFRDYDQRVLFQGFNEPTDTDDTWDYPGQKAIDRINELNQLFVDTIRATGGRNAYRTLVLAPYAGSHEQEIIDGFRLPKDTVGDRLMVSVNAYTPALFSYVVDTETTSFTDVHEWGSEADKAELDALFDRLHKRFTANGIPVMIGEFCTADKGNTADRARHAAYYTAAAAERGIPCFWWDDGDLLLRKALSWGFPEIVEAMVDSTSVHMRHVGVAGLKTQYYTGQAVIPPLTLVWSPNGVDAALLSDADAGPQAVVSGSDPQAVVLTEGVDYELMCFNNVEKGTAEVSIRGIGKYSGLYTGTFEIVEKPKEIDPLSLLAGDNPELPFVIMLTVPVLLILCFITGLKYIRRRERSRIEATVGAAMAEELEARGQSPEDYGYGSSALYKGDRSYDNNRALNEYMREGEYDDFG